ncbi:YbhN family protein [Gordonia sp. NB41Y]|uniref:lysylphosphatidylglycerol synthase transmembrane domain-containing protein n=1 Tax=Gordonia sp. NB41Y TaxID=875808 RepID=UPI0006B15F33|nr:YbhN family protein [Gordonia sp. NB41Y]EMP12775.2 membrane protein [Gordonia sp. NB41Y]WLP88913.1 YbhN family protein [Gordonia sp. NB41Y]
MSSDSPTVPHPDRRHRFWWARWVLLAVVVVILAVEVVLIWPSLEKAWERTDQLDWVWLVACIVAAMLSMDSFAQVQRALLRSAGVVVSQMKSLSVVLAANSLSQTMPGGQVLAPAFTYRETRKWGASPVVASWQVVMSGLLAGVGLAVLGFGGAVLAGARTSPFSVMFSVIGFIAVVAVLQYLATHPETLQSGGERALGWINQLRNKPADHGVARLSEILDQLRAVQLTRRDTATAFGWSLFNWITDIACLLFACWAVGANPAISGVMVAYAAGKAVGTAVPLLPGGIGVVDAVLVPALTTADMPAADALTAVLVYRLISYVLVSAVGWVVILVKFRTGIRDKDTLEDEYDRDLGIDPDADQVDTAPLSRERPPDPDPDRTDTERLEKRPGPDGPARGATDRSASDAPDTRPLRRPDDDAD